MLGIWAGVMGSNCALSCKPRSELKSPKSTEEQRGSVSDFHIPLIAAFVCGVDNVQVVEAIMTE